MVELTYKVSSPALESIDVKHSIADYSLVKYPSWEKAFTEIGFKRISRESAARLASVDDPRDIQNDNTYNRDALVWRDVNYGVAETPRGTVISFKVHSGEGDIRGGYSDSTYMLSPDKKDGIIYALFELLNPEVVVDVYRGDELLATARRVDLGYVEFEKSFEGISKEDIHDMLNSYEAGRTNHFEVSLD